MILKEGMVIHTFPDTDSEAYVRMIREYGFRAEIYKDHIRVGKPLRFRKLDTVKLSSLIRKKRMLKKMTMTDLANKLQTRVETVLGWEMGRSIPRNDFLDDLIIILDITEGELEECRTINQ
jgi:hypothetical protein